MVGTNLRTQNLLLGDKKIKIHLTHMIRIMKNLPINLPITHLNTHPLHISLLHTSLHHIIRLHLMGMAPKSHLQWRDHIQEVEATHRQELRVHMNLVVPKSTDPAVVINHHKEVARKYWVVEMDHNKAAARKYWVAVMDHHKAVERNKSPVVIAHHWAVGRNKSPVAMDHH